METKYLKYLIVILIAISLFIYFIRYLSFTKYNVRPLEECDKYLKETYYGEFKGKTVDFYKYNGYYVWKIYYIDEMGMEFDEYYRHPMEVPEGGLYLFYANDRKVSGVCDHYWQKKLEKVFENDFQIRQYESDLNLCIVKFTFNIVEESDIEDISNIVTTTLFYTKNNVKKMSQNIIGYSVGYKNKTGIYKLILDEMIQELLDEERDDLFHYIYDEIYNNYQKEVEK